VTFKDHFSGHAAGYAAYRPVYPLALVEALAGLSSRHEVAWDCGCGSGQLSVLLAERFAHVIATDASAQQIAHATQHPRVEYRCVPAEVSGLADASIDLIVVAQAVHWFDLPAFYREVRRVARPGAPLALVTYNLLHIDERIDRIIGAYYYGVVNAYWPPERRLVEENYRSLDFPFRAIDPPSIAMTAEWSLPEVLGYVETWSAVVAARKAIGSAPMDRFAAELTAAWIDAWGDANVRREVRWPLALRVGFVDAAPGVA
jgi:SAM-dependent methyltransferase